jgi:hypothetical protein
MSGIQLGDLVSFLHESFPINPNLAIGDPKRAIEQFYAEEIGTVQVLCNPVPELSQGDILTSIPFIDFSDDGKLFHFITPGMIVTSSCDLDRKDKIVFCPCFPLEQFRALKAYKEISKNHVFEFFFIGRVSTGEEWVVDLSNLMTLRRSRVFHQIQTESISRMHSLTQIGWYIFITKFSMKYFRPDDPENMRLRETM